MIVRTVSGSTYTIVDGRITRDAKVNPYIPPDLQVSLPAQEPVLVLRPAAPGKQLVYRIKRTGEVVTTSQVKEIEFHDGLIWSL